MTLFKKAKEITKGMTGILDFGEQQEEKVREKANEESIEEKSMKFLNEHKPNKTSLNIDTEEMSRGEDSFSSSESIVNKNSRLKIYKPTYYEVVQNIGKDIIDGKIVLIDLSSLDEKTTIKIIQFVSGMCFALGIEPEDVSSKIISIDPQNKAKR